MQDTWSEHADDEQARYVAAYRRLPETDEEIAVAVAGADDTTAEEPWG